MTMINTHKLDNSPDSLNTATQDLKYAANHRRQPDEKRVNKKSRP